MVNEEKKVEKTLVGKTIMLDPRQGGMYMFPDISLDTKTGLVLSTLDSGRDRFEVKPDMEQTTIIKGIRVGILRVLDKSGEDVSKDFGGQLRYNPFSPLVTVAPKPVNEEKDKYYLEILNSNDLKSIKDRLMLINNREELNRIRELEEKGENPAAQSRSYVLDCIEKIKKSLPGVDTNISIEPEMVVEVK